MLLVKYINALLLAIILLQPCRAVPFVIVNPYTIGFAVGAVTTALGWIGRSLLRTVNPNCPHNECCMSPYLKHDIDGLRIQLQKNLFGQHIVQDILIDALRGHLSNTESQKPLVMYFDGTTGTGKNYVTNFVITSLYEQGNNSTYVHKYAANYWIRNSADQVTNKLIDEIMTSIKACPYSLFVFDETQRMPTGALDALISLLDHHTSSPEYDYTKSIFIFLSNNAGVQIANRLEKLTVKTYRDQTTLEDYEGEIETAVYNMVGAFRRSKIISSNVIDHFIPFLPLEERHVKQCIERDFMLLCPEKMTKANIEKVAAMVKNKKEEKKDEKDEKNDEKDEKDIFQHSGCKRVNKKVEPMCYRLD